MTHDPDRKLELRLVPADSPADPLVLDDLIRLIRQGLATASKEMPRVGDGPGFRPPTADERNTTADLEAKIKHRIEQDPDSHGSIAKRAELTSQPDHEQKLADEMRVAAEYVAAAVQSALLRGAEVRVPDAVPPTGDAS
ncbi:MAG TPA: hypothetical protein VFG68_10290 [Fimbriiglobus sp.]|nr:hypothetical protein [Fimbriiglobus sp.]